MNSDSATGGLPSLPGGLSSSLGAGTGVLGAVETGGTNPIADLNAIGSVAKLGNSTGLVTLPAGTSAYMGGLSSIVGAALQGGQNPVSDIQAASGAAKIAGQAGLIGTDTASSLTAALGIAGVGAELGMIDYNAIDPANVPDTEKSMLPGETNAKLASGNTVAELGGVGVGLGSEETQGSGEIYKTDGTTTPSWIGQQYSGELEKDSIAEQLAAAGPQTQAQYDQSSGINPGGTMTGNLFGSTVTTTTGPTNILSGQSNTSAPATQAQLNAGAATAQANMESIFNATGGAAGWGVSQAQWMQSMQSLLGSISDNGTYWGNT